jgi:hypothetical protein
MSLDLHSSSAASIMVINSLKENETVQIKIADKD